MASSHNLKDPNGDPLLSPQEKSIDVRVPKEHVDGRFERMQQHVPEGQFANEIPNNEQVLVHKKIDVLNTNEQVTKVSSDKQVKTNIKYDFDDIDIVPKSQTYLNSRYDGINPYYQNHPINGFYLPLMTAPMDSVVDFENAYFFQKNKINVVLPRTEKEIRFGCFKSYGLKDIPIDLNTQSFALLDVANGHMSSVIEWCSKLKKEYPNVKIMAGNIANPQTYNNYCSSGVIDYARVGIGNGNGCLTTQQTGVGYPMASLIRECYEIKIKHNNPVKIIADGGMKDYRDIIIALALGADYVMIGSIFAKAIESSAPNYWGNLKLSKGIASYMYKNGFNIHKEFRGMSTKQAQKDLGNTHIKTSEGVVRKLKVEYTLEQWVSNFEHYLRSAMSYSNANTLSNFIGQADTIIVSNNSVNRYKK
jgi:IMP dehydrogenase/GMP reductase